MLAILTIGYIHTIHIVSTFEDCYMSLRWYDWLIIVRSEMWDNRTGATILSRGLARNVTLSLFESATINESILFENLQRESLTYNYAVLSKQAPTMVYGQVFLIIIWWPYQYGIHYPHPEDVLGSVMDRTQFWN